MKRSRQTPAEPLRIALVWDSSAMRSQQVLSGLCRRADAETGLYLRRFDALSADFSAAVIKPLHAWNPQGIILRMEDTGHLQLLRKFLPDIPIVAACRVPANIADTMVMGSATEVTLVSSRHFLEQGVHTIALWAPGQAAEAEVLASLFHEVVPNGPVFAYPLSSLELREQPKGKALQSVGNWLKSLKKPAGVLTFSSDGGPYLSRVCQEIGLRVPAEIRLIGCDDPDACMGCIPHLSTVIPTGELIGESAMEMMLQYLRSGQQRPPSELRVEGCTLTARGSTGHAPLTSRSVARATDLIHAQATTGLTTSKLVRMTRQGRSTFYKQFRETTGTTPGKQLRKRRMSVACQLLTGSTANISQIAEQCGFSSANYFAQIFRREFGIPPSEYRRENR